MLGKGNIFCAFDYIYSLSIPELCLSINCFIFLDRRFILATASNV